VNRSAVLELFAWRQPRRASAQRPLVEAILAEADLLGVTAAGGLPGWTRTQLAADGGSAPGAAIQPSTAAEYALARALPAPVDHFLVQPDLTVVVPGPPERHVAAELGVLADLESTGGANVYRITERSVRRALDAGRSGEQLATFVSEHSRTPVPQALRYLVDDAARRHGVLRAGAATAYLRCEDEALLARVVADTHVEAAQLRLIAPTVAVSPLPVNRVLEVLRAAGQSPAAEAPGGELITLTPDAPRAPARQAGRPTTSRGVADSGTQLIALVRRIRAGDAITEAGRRTHPIAASIPGVTSAATMELLRRAVREELLIGVGVAAPDGSIAVHELRPISLAAGFVRGFEEGQSGLVSYPVHRITAVRVLDEDDA
jgi:hypothetical protein